MKIRHTHRTHQIRSDYELAALCAVVTFNHGREATPFDINEFEAKYRGHPDLEKALRALADWMEKAAPNLEFEEHACGGQLCDQDGLYDVSLVVRKSDQRLWKEEPMTAKQAMEVEIRGIGGYRGDAIERAVYGAIGAAAALANVGLISLDEAADWREAARKAGDTQREKTNRRTIEG